MHQQGQITTFQQRLEITELSAAGQTDPQIAQLMHCSIYTVRKWRRRFKKQGRTGLSSQMGRPRSGILSKCSNELKQTIVQLRKDHPGWGPITLLVAFKNAIKGTASYLPSRARLAVFLKESGLSRTYQPHTELVQPAKEPLEKPHQEWQLDGPARTLLSPGTM